MSDVITQQHIDAYTWFHSFEFEGLTASGLKPIHQVRAEAQAYFGNIDITGRSVIDIGTWTGYMSFEAERRGARRVVASDDFVWNDKRFNGREPFELAHRLLKSNVEPMVVDVPEFTRERVGTFDVVLFLGVFYHLFDAPTLTKQISKVASDLLIVETHQDEVRNRKPAMAFYPGETLNGDGSNWWGPNPHCLYEMLKECGFERIFYQDYPMCSKDPTDPDYRSRGVYHAFRNESALRRYLTRNEGWYDLSIPEQREAVFQI